ncbi:A disintegrin and metalloproteinase with thrombospondin motifs 6-like [Tubulanus polymorphus]|uniref:A disintegrin and metalloproteinase with thrombospondin motifs 6-like n=1 Tax=Tubulanus polymorphus TaxID=672921 RepID=UPI003DA695B1
MHVYSYILVVKGPIFLTDEKIKSRRRRSASTDRYVETLVVADKYMVQFYGKDVEKYILTLMKIVASIFKDPSIGNSINIVVNRIIILNYDEPKLHLGHHADKVLGKFCKWQKLINLPENEVTNLQHHDHAIFITRYDICSKKDKPCGTVGLAPVGGMCNPTRSCSVIEDRGLATAFTVAHELGHNFGMHHDGLGNPCGDIGHESARLMAAQINKHIDLFSWSSCSRDYITHYLDSGKADCLLNVPVTNNYEYADTLPGLRYDADKQCQFAVGKKSRICGNLSCKELRCLGPYGSCLTTNLPAADGTNCSSNEIENGWCYQSKCVIYGEFPEEINGNWSEWSDWSQCSRTCGGGVMKSYRNCDNPSPTHGGRYCLGDRKRFRSCNAEPCPEGAPSFREVQCASYNNIPFRGKRYTWRPYAAARIDHCALYCMAEKFHFYVEKSPKVIDGTLCYQGSTDICIDGQCKAVGCDKKLGSSAKNDKCGVCNGDGNSCRAITATVKKEVKYGKYEEILRIPRGATSIKVEELNISRNYLALKSESGNFYINGDWIIDWPQTYYVAGTLFHYHRDEGKLEYLEAPGPTTENLIIMVLPQEYASSGIKYTLSVPLVEGPLNNSISDRTQVQSIWITTRWSKCSQDCGGGIKYRHYACVREDDKTLSDESLCKSPKPTAKERRCNVKPCRPQWALGEWSTCSKSCGGGITTRRVLCIKDIENRKHEVVENSTCSEKAPLMVSVCNKKRCPPQWITGHWSKCSKQCGQGTKTRFVLCLSKDGKTFMPHSTCDPKLKPTKATSCFTTKCIRPRWVMGKWSQCSVSCGKGTKIRTVECRDYKNRITDSCKLNKKPPKYVECGNSCKTSDHAEVCEDYPQVKYCPLVKLYNFCSRQYFRKTCCKSCEGIA